MLKGKNLDENKKLDRILDNSGNSRWFDNHGNLSQAITGWGPS